MHRVILHVDMDAFFASVEQRDNPEFRNKPLIVGAPPERRGVVCAASYEARRFGVRSAMPSKTAAKLCPHGIFVRPRMEAYRAESDEIMAIFSDYTGMVEQVSVDEAYLDLSHAFGHAESIDIALRNSLPLAIDIKSRIASERGLSASIGVAGNKFLSKLGSDFKKPNGLTLITEAEKISFLRPLPVGSIIGVGPVTAKELESLNLLTIGDLQDTSLDLTPVFGSATERFRKRAFGVDERPLEVSRERKSISAEHTFPEDTDDRVILRAALGEMAEEIAADLESRGIGALTIQVKVRYEDFTTLTRQIRSEEPVSGAREIYRLGCHLLATHRLVKGPLRLLGLGASTLISGSDPQLKLPLD